MVDSTGYQHGCAILWYNIYLHLRCYPSQLQSVLFHLFLGCFLTCASDPASDRWGGEWYGAKYRLAGTFLWSGTYLSNLFCVSLTFLLVDYRRLREFARPSQSVC